MSVTIAPVCGALGCTCDGEVVVDHPDHGERVVCGDHADGHEEAQREIRAAALKSLPYHYNVLCTLVRTFAPVESHALHEAYETVASEAYANRTLSPIGARSRALKLRKLAEYDLVEWEDHDDNSRTYRVTDERIESACDLSKIGCEQVTDPVISK